MTNEEAEDFFKGDDDDVFPRTHANPRKGGRRRRTRRKGSPSKTHKGDEDYTTKRGSHDFHVGHHDVKPRKPFTKKKRGGKRRKTRRKGGRRK